MSQFWPPVASDTGWITPTLNTGWTALVGETPQYRLIGDDIKFRGRGNSTGATADAFTLPFTMLVQVVGQTDANGTPARCIVRTTGAVGQVTAAAVTAFSFGGFPPITR
ncbi:hypothetical protein GCM10022239_03280 [Leifsonia bigeumensis]|uniref:Uncharacterized protein n=1 Tax=Leifsonella bigeumensis TaxID=433643 RepID=A0ABP7F448_9MICO